MPSTAAMWQSLAGTMFADITDEFLGAFRRPGGANRRLGSWDPVDTGTRYFKTLLYNAAAAQPPAFFRAWPKLGRTDLGDPLHVTVGACRIDLDYLLAVQEVLFVGQSMDAGDCRHIVEIGAGFGRTCHAFLALWETVESYTIIDLPPLLNLSRAYLGKVLPPSDLTRVRFIATESPQWRAMASDLVINIDSMQEMPEATISAYFTDLIAHSRAFYTRNPTGKYDPTLVGLREVPAEVLAEVESLGLCRERVDLFDQADLTRAARRYVARYRPTGWTVMGEAPSLPFTWYHHALYHRPAG